MPWASTHLYPPKRHKHVTFTTTLHLTPSPVFALCNTAPQIAEWDWYIYMQTVNNTLCGSDLTNRDDFSLCWHKAKWRREAWHTRSHGGVRHPSWATGWMRFIQGVIKGIVIALWSFEGDGINCRFYLCSSTCRQASERKCVIIIGPVGNNIYFQCLIIICCRHYCYWMIFFSISLQIWWVSCHAYG